MKMAKASEADITMALDLVGAMDSIMRYGQLPDPADDRRLDLDDPDDARLALRTLIGIANRGSLGRVVMGMVTLLDPRNAVVDPDSDVLELHPKHAPPTPRPLAEYHEDHGPVVWWKFPVNEPSWIGSPTCDDWPGYHTHWTPHPPIPHAAAAQEGFQ